MKTLRKACPCINPDNSYRDFGAILAYPSKAVNIRVKKSYACLSGVKKGVLWGTKRAGFHAGHSVSTKWLCHFVEFAFFTVSEADDREKWQEWFRLWLKPPCPTGIAGRYESSQRIMMPL